MRFSAIQVWLLALSVSLGALAILLEVLGPGIPYGRWAWLVQIGSGALGVWVAIRFIQDRRASRALETGDVLTMKAEAIPKREDQTYLGEAFLWGPRHVQLLERNLAAAAEPSEATLLRLGGNPLIHGVGRFEERPIFIPNAKRSHHMLVMGSPGEGKTRCLDLLVRQLIAMGEVVVVIDPKGDDRLLSMVRQAAQESGRGDQFRLFALPWPSASVAYNPLANFGTPSDIADRLIAILPPATGDSEPFRGFQWSATKAVVQAMFVAGIPITIAGILAGMRDLWALATRFAQARFPDLPVIEIGEYVEDYDLRIARNPAQRCREFDDLLAFAKLDSGYYLKMIGSFLPVLDRLSTGPKRELLSPDPEENQREVLTWSAIDQRGLVVYVYLGSLHGEESANAVGKMMLLDLEAYIAARYSYAPERMSRRMSLIVDEAHHMVSQPFMSVLAEARGANLGVVLSSQTLAQFEQALGSRAAVDEILTQHFLHVQFQSRNPREAEDFSKLAGDRLFRRVGEAYRYEPAFFESGDRNVGDFRAMHQLSIRDEEAPLVPPSAITQLPTFHFFARMAGLIYKGRIPLLEAPEGSVMSDLKRGLGV